MKKRIPATVAALVVLLGCGGVASTAEAAGKGVDPALRGLPTVAQLPPGTVPISPVVPGMGAHWANPKDLPLGPVYCVIQGRIVCAEFMISQKNYEAGKSFLNLKAPLRGRALPPMDHININFEPHGHPGFTEPHFDNHMYFIPQQDIDRLTKP